MKVAVITQGFYSRDEHLSIHKITITLKYVLKIAVALDISGGVSTLIQE